MVATNPTTPIKPAAPGTVPAVQTAGLVGKAIAQAATKSVEKAKESKDKKPDNDNRHKAMMRVKIGKLEFNSQKGEILSPSYVWLSTRRFSEARIVLDDPEDKIRDKIGDQQDIEIEVGFVDGARKNKLTGKIYKLGRREPDGTVIIAVDPSVQLQQQSGAAAVFNDNQPAEAKERFTNDTQKLLKDIQEQPLLKDAKGQPLEFSGETVEQPRQQGNSFLALSQELEKASKAVAEDKTKASAAEQFTLKNYPNLKFAKSTTTATGAQGVSTLQQTEMQVANKQAALQGDVVVARGNTVRQISPGKADPSGLVLDYDSNRSVFIGKPEILKRTGLQLQSGGGALTVQGWNADTKQVVGATVVSPVAASPHPTGVIAVPDWGQIKLNDPIIPGSMYTWSDATFGGQRVPTKEIMGRIAAIAKVITELTEKTVGKGNRWTITSWYRDPEANRKCGGASQSRHMVGDAVDFHYDVNGTERALFDQMQSSWNGGLAFKYKEFVHIDLGERGRWEYPS